MRCTLAAVLLVLASCSSQPSSTAPATPGPASAPVVTSKWIPTPHRQWLNLAYATRFGYEKPDLYMPAHLPAHSRPPGLVVYVHGGGWLEAGNVKANFVSQTFANFFLATGYAIASVNYRLSSQAHFPAQIQDVKTAVRWLRAHAGQYGYDPDEIAAMGDSAEGQLVGLLGTSQGAPALEGASLEYLGAPLQTVPARARAADPITYLTPGRPLPRFLIAQGTHDCTVPYQGAVEFYQALVNFAGPPAAQLILEPGKGHFSPPAEVNFNFTELEAPVIKLLRETIGPA